MEIISKVEFPKRHKAYEPDALSPSFFKDSGEVLKLELTKLGIILDKWKDS